MYNYYNNALFNGVNSCMLFYKSIQLDINYTN